MNLRKMKSLLIPSVALKTFKTKFILTSQNKDKVQRLFLPV